MRPRSTVARLSVAGALLLALPVSPARAQKGCDDDARSLASISVDYPHGGDRLVVWKSGDAALFYGALARHRTVARGAFDVDEFHERLRPRLHPNAPREEWPDPTSEAGMVQLGFEDGTEESYLIFDEEAFAERLFEKARANVVGRDPPRR